MLIAQGTTDKFQIVSSTGADAYIHASYVVTDSSVGGSSSMAPTPSNTHLGSGSGSTTDVVPSPGASKVANLKYCHVRNNDATLSTVITAQLNVSAATFPVISVTLLPGESLIFREGMWFHLDAGGSAYATPTFDPSQLKALKNSSVADQTISSATTAYLTGSSILLPATRVVGMVLRWRVFVGKSAAGTAADSWLVKFGTAGTTADTTQFTFAGDTETAAADEAEYLIQATLRGPIGASCVVECTRRLLHNLTTTGFSATASARVARNTATFDITPSGLIAGLTVTTGTSDVYTVRQVTAELLQV